MSGLQAQLAAAFALSLLGGVHCAAMCGGFVGALQARRPAALRALPFSLAYQVGRVLAYATAGVLIGAIGGVLFAAHVLPLQIALLVLASLVLAGVGLSLLGATAWMRILERVGGRLWRLIQPVAQRVLPPRSFPAAALAGFVWGWIPCGMVYAALPLALISGSAWHGALVMLAFGAGTLPNMLALEFGASMMTRTPTLSRAAAQSSSWRALRGLLRPATGLAILLFAASDLAHAVHLAGSHSSALALLESICHSTN